MAMRARLGAAVRDPEEKVLLRVRPGATSLAGRVVVGVLGAGLLGVATTWLPLSWRTPGGWLLGALALLLLGLLVVLPLLRRPATCLVTSRRILTSWGVTDRVGREVPLSRVVDVQLEQTPWGAAHDVGTLVLHTDGGDPLRLPDVSEVAKAQVLITGLILDSAGQ